MSDPSITNNALLSGIIGLVVGALVIYFGIDNLTQKMMSVSENLGALQESMKISKESIDEAKNSAKKTLINIENLEIQAKEISDKLKKVESSTTTEISRQLEIISTFSGDQQALVQLAEKTSNIENSISGQLVYSCPPKMPTGCDAAQHCQSMCTGQLQINNNTCIHRLPGGAQSAITCTLVGKLVKP